MSEEEETPLFARLPPEQRHQRCIVMTPSAEHKQKRSKPAEEASPFRKLPMEVLSNVLLDFVPTKFTAPPVSKQLTAKASKLAAAQFCPLDRQPKYVPLVPQEAKHSPNDDDLICDINPFIRPLRFSEPHKVRCCPPETIATLVG